MNSNRLVFELKEHGWTITALAQHVGHPREVVSRTLNYLKRHPNVRRALKSVVPTLKFQDALLRASKAYTPAKAQAAKKAATKRRSK